MGKQEQAVQNFGYPHLIKVVFNGLFREICEVFFYSKYFLYELQIYYFHESEIVPYIVLGLCDVL